MHSVESIDPRPVNLGFCCDRQTALDAIYRMGVHACDYSGTDWSRFCDCKYGAGAAPKFPHGEVNGCPELRSLYGVVHAMTDQEWNRFVRRAKKPRKAA